MDNKSLERAVARLLLGNEHGMDEMIRRMDRLMEEHQGHIDDPKTVTPESQKHMMDIMKEMRSMMEEMMMNGM